MINANIYEFHEIFEKQQSCLLLRSDLPKINLEFSFLIFEVKYLLAAVRSEYI